MRTSRRFSPAFDCMSARIAPSSVSLISPVAHMVASAPTAMDSTGDPTTEPTSGGTGPIIATPPTGGTDPGLC
jgi:hypothetical protein